LKDFPAKNIRLIRGWDDLLHLETLGVSDHRQGGIGIVESRAWRRRKLAPVFVFGVVGVGDELDG